MAEVQRFGGTDASIYPLSIGSCHYESVDEQRYTVPYSQYLHKTESNYSGWKPLYVNYI